MFETGQPYSKRGCRSKFKSPDADAVALSDRFKLLCFGNERLMDNVRLGPATVSAVQLAIVINISEDVSLMALIDESQNVEDFSC